MDAVPCAFIDTTKSPIWEIENWSVNSPRQVGLDDFDRIGSIRIVREIFLDHDRRYIISSITLSIQSTRESVAAREEENGREENGYRKVRVEGEMVATMTASLSSANGLLTMLSKPHPELNLHAQEKLNSVITSSGMRYPPASQPYA